MVVFSVEQPGISCVSFFYNSFCKLIASLGNLLAFVMRHEKDVMVSKRQAKDSALCRKMKERCILSQSSQSWCWLRDTSFEVVVHN